MIINNGELKLGDCLLELGKIMDNSIDLSIIDPPYNVGYKYNSYSDKINHDEYIKWQIKTIDLIGRKLVKGGSIVYITYPELGAEIFTNFLKDGYSVNSKEIATWVYNTNLGGKYLRKASRMCVWLSKGEPKLNKITGEYKNPNDKRIKERIKKGLLPKEMDWFYINQVKNVSKKHNHPCELPQDILIKFITGLTNEGDTVIDCFAGSGSLAIACEKTNRKWICIEKDEYYFNLIKTRLGQN